MNRVVERGKGRWCWRLAGGGAIGLLVLWFASTYFRAVVWAVLDRDGTMLRVLLFSRGAEVSQPPSWAGRTPLFEAALRGRADIVKALLAKGADPKVKDSLGDTALSAAVIFGRSPEAVRALLAKGADPNVTWLQEGVLTKAAEHADLEVVRLLLDAGADINARTLPNPSSGDDAYPKQTALGAAFRCGSSALWHAEECRHEGKPREAKRYEQASSRAAEVAKLLIGRGADLHADALCPSLLFAAVTWCRPDLVKLLLEKGEDVNRRESTFTRPDGKRQGGATPLRAAAGLDQMDTANLLLKAGADPDLADEEGTTPLMAAVRWKGNAKVIRALLAKGARTDAKDKSGKTALDWAREKKREDIVRLLQQAQVKQP